MRVSIVTPSYNQARFLEETIRSVLDSHIPNLEYFVMDGASTDSSVEIIQKYEQRLTAWVSEKDKGQADAINKGLHQANGDIVAWLNSDDYYLPGAIELAIRTFEQHPEAGLVYGNVLSVDAESKPFNLQTFQGFSLIDLMSFRIISQPAVFIRRSVLEKAGYLDPSYHCLLDHHLWLRMSLLAPCLYIPNTLAAARYHAEAKNLARTADLDEKPSELWIGCKIIQIYRPSSPATKPESWAGRIASMRFTFWTEENTPRPFPPIDAPSATVQRLY